VWQAVSGTVGDVVSQELNEIANTLSVSTRDVCEMVNEHAEDTVAEAHFSVALPQMHAILMAAP